MEGMAASGLDAVDFGTGMSREDEQCLRSLAFILDARDPGAFLESISVARISCDASIYGLSNIARRPEGADRLPNGPEEYLVLGGAYRWLGSLGRVAPLPDLQHQLITVESISVSEVLLEDPADLVDILAKPISDSWGKHVFQALGVAGNSAFWGSMIEHAGDDDQEALDRQREKAALRASHKPGTMGEGLKLGFSRAGDNIMEGLRGAVHRPLEGARKDGVQGFFKGVGTGALGLLAKPVAGVMAIGEQFNDRAGANSNRMRAPRAVYHNTILRKFDAVEAEVYGSLIAGSEEQLVAAVKAEAQVPKKATSFRKSVEADAAARAAKSVSGSMWGMGGMGGTGGWGFGAASGSSAGANGAGWSGLGGGLGSGSKFFEGLPPALGGSSGATPQTAVDEVPDLVLVVTTQRLTLTWASEAAAAAAAAATSKVSAASAAHEICTPKGGWEAKLDDVTGLEDLQDGTLAIKTKSGLELRAVCTDASQAQDMCRRVQMALDSRAKGKD